MPIIYTAEWMDGNGDQGKEEPLWLIWTRPCLPAYLPAYHRYLADRNIVGNGWLVLSTDRTPSPADVDLQPMI